MERRKRREWRIGEYIMENGRGENGDMVEERMEIREKR